MSMPRTVSFEDIEVNLRMFFQSTEDFKDVNWEGSVASQLLRILAFDQRTASLFLGMVMNESRTSTASTRKNSAAAASALNGYIASNRKAATCPIRLRVTSTSPIQTNPQIITIQTNTKFFSNINGVPCTFINREPFDLSLSNDGSYMSEPVLLTQGEKVLLRFDVIGGIQEMVIDDKSIDNSTLIVNVKEEDGVIRAYQRFNPLQDSERVYFLRLLPDGRMSIEFDSNLGRKPKAGERVYAEYLSTKGVSGNGAIKLSLSTSIQGFSNSVVEVLSPSAGGADPEDAETIKRYAPLGVGNSFSCVTSSDFIYSAKELLGDGYSITSWGGETNTPTMFGYQMVAVKPIGSDLASNAIKQDLLDFLTPRCVGSITPIVYDAEFTYIRPEIEIIFAKNETVLSESDLKNKVRNFVVGYSQANLERFSSIFDSFSFNNAVLGADRSIKKVFASYEFFKEYDISSVPTLEGEYNFGFKIKEGSIVVTGFRPVYLGAEDFEWELRDIGGVLKLIKYSESGEEIDPYNFSSSIDYSSGSIRIGNLPVTGSQTTRVYVKKDDIDQSLTPVRNQVLKIVEPTVV